MANRNLGEAKKAKNDEFYTQYADIQKEVNAYLEYDHDVFKGKTILLPCDDPEWSNFTLFFAQNFTKFGLKKLISTSYAAESKNFKHVWQPSLFEQESPQFDPDKTKIKGKVFVLTRGKAKTDIVDHKDIKWKYLEGDGDFRSDEVKALRDEADIIVTNPPFSLFREFLAWILDGRAVSMKPPQPKKFLIIGNMNAITYKEVFPLIKENRMWLGESIHSGDREFAVPDEYPLEAAGCRYDPNGKRFKKYIRVKGMRWFTNLDHGRRHRPLELMTMADNIKHSTHKELRGIGYKRYDNYDAIEVPYTDAIPSDYDGVMGVPKSYLDKYCPEQFEIIGCAEGESGRELGLKPFDRALKKLNPSLRDGQLYYMENGVPVKPYARILIRRRG